MTIAVEAPTYPLYHIGVRWSEDGEHDPKWPNRHKDLPPGRIWNGTSLNRMYREERTVEDLEAYVRGEWWPEMIEQPSRFESTKIVDRSPDLVSVDVTFVCRESWCCTWFNHWTFDVGQSDAEALASFEAYVRRHEWYQDRLGLDSDALDEELAERGIGRRVCLMGATDRWRWKSDAGDPPCRCEHCQKQGVIRIDH